MTGPPNQAWKNLNELTFGQGSQISLSVDPTEINQETNIKSPY